MQISVRRTDKAAILELTGRIDLSSSAEVRKILLHELRESRTPRVILNLEKVKYIDKALDVIAGYVVLNDASARDWQRAGTQWTAGKNFEGSMPIGPELVTADEVDVSDIALTTTLNGQVMQSARTSQMIVDVPSAIEFFSSFTRLAPGDVIATGTPGGVGFARQPPVWLEPGDTIEITIESVGTIRNRVVAEEGDRSDWRWRPSSQTPTGF